MSLLASKCPSGGEPAWGPGDQAGNQRPECGPDPAGERADEGHKESEEPPGGAEDEAGTDSESHPAAGGGPSRRVNRPRLCRLDVRGSAGSVSGIDRVYLS